MSRRTANTQARRSNVSSRTPYSELPQVSAVVAEIRARGASSLGDETLVEFIRERLEQLREAIDSGEPLRRDEIIDGIVAAARELERSRLTPVINATGVLIHTNLGRSPVSDETAQAMALAAMNSVPLEIDPETNERGGRMSEASRLMRLLTGAESTLIVNNNAAAVLLTLSALASGRSVLVSRGEAVEIGGGFRVPDVMAQSGARLVDVGTTNRTYARDYERAIDQSTAALLKVHRSNFDLRGFVHDATTVDLSAVAERHGVPLIFDLGSGAIIDPSRFGISGESTVREAIRDGASVVLSSGDKLFGGPQAGIIAGRRDLIERIAAHPLARAVRADKTCLAGVASTLRHYARDEATSKIPIWRMISASPDELRARADRILERAGDARLKRRQSTATIGGGAAPAQEVVSWAISFTPSSPAGLDEIARKCRVAEPGLFGRIEGNALLFDLRSVLPEQDEVLASVLREQLAGA